MEINEIMINEEMDMENEVVTCEGAPENSNMGTVVAMAIGAGLTIAATAAVKFGKKAYAKWQARKELRKPDPDKIVEVTDEEIVEVVASEEDADK